MTLKMGSVRRETPPAEKPVSLNGTPAFGKEYTPGMLLCEYKEGSGWQDARIVPRGPLPLDPATMSLHYAQSIFEGMKLHWLASGKKGLFRPLDHGERFKRSAERMVMAPMDPELFTTLVTEFARHQQGALPDDPALSLYFRPLSFGVDTALGLRASKNFQFLILGMVVAEYFKSGSSLKVWVNEETVRACPKGLGAAKTAANYAASLHGQVQAVKMGCDQALWLDGKESRYVEELGAMNLFFVQDGVLKTPILSDSILAGITRSSLLTLAKEAGLKTEETRLAWPELAQGIKEGRVTEAFGAGTAAVVSPIGQFLWQGQWLKLPEPKPVADRLRKALTDIQKGVVSHPWIVEI